MRSSASRATSIAAVSTMSWVVAPQWTYRPASPAAAASARTSGSTGLPIRRASSANDATSNRPASQHAAIASAASAGITPAARLGARERRLGVEHRLEPRPVGHGLPQRRGHEDRREEPLRHGIGSPT